MRRSSTSFPWVSPSRRRTTGNFLNRLRRIDQDRESLRLRAPAMTSHMRTEYCGNIDTRFLGKSVTLYGWAHRRRDHGGVIFIDLRDREGLVQVVSDPDRKETFAAADRVRNEFVLRVTGVVRPRPQGTVNANLKSGEIEVLA